MSATTTKPLTPCRAIRAKCLDCSGGKATDVRNCHITGCALFAFRMGRNPNYLMKKDEAETE